MGNAVSDSLALAQAIEKLGIIGVLVLIGSLLGVAAWYFRKELVKAHETIATLKQMLLVVKLAADSAGVKYDLREVGDLEALLKR